MEALLEVPMPRQLAAEMLDLPPGGSRKTCRMRLNRWGIGFCAGAQGMHEKRSIATGLLE